MMKRKSGKRTEGALGATPASGPMRPGNREAPRPFRDRPTPAGATGRPPLAAAAPGVRPAGPTTHLAAPIEPALYARLRRYADDSGSSVEAGVVTAIEAFLQGRGY
jgi:hypothetical protein